MIRRDITFNRLGLRSDALRHIREVHSERLKEISSNRKSVYALCILTVLLLTFLFFFGITHVGSQKLHIIKFSPSKIMDGLYLGSFADALNKEKLREIGVTHILSINFGQAADYCAEFEYLLVAIDDAPNSDLLSYFELTHEFIDNAMSKNGTILVHCFHGISRSSSIVISYVMKLLAMDFGDAYKFVKDKRKAVVPKIWFKHQLGLFQVANFRYNHPTLRKEAQELQIRPKLFSCKDGITKELPQPYGIKLSIINELYYNFMTYRMYVWNYILRPAFMPLYNLETEV